MQATASVSVGPGVRIDSSDAGVAPKGSVALTASGGSGTGFVWSFVGDPRGGSLAADAGAATFTAGATGAVTIQILATDDLGNEGVAVMNVGPALQIAPRNPLEIEVGEPLQFSASGGQPPYVFSTVPSSTAIDPSTGLFVPTAAINPTIRVTDAVGAKSQTGINVKTGLQVTTPQRVAPREPVSLHSYGGFDPKAYALITNTSGATLTGTSYVAGPTPNTTDVVRATDAHGLTADLTLNVGPGVTLDPPAAITAPNLTVQFTASGGTDAGFVYAIVDAGSGGATISSTGLYRAGMTGSGLDVISVHDSVGNAATATIDVAAALAIVPNAPRLPPRGTLQFTTVGGLGAKTWSLPYPTAGASIDVHTGLYRAGPNAHVPETIQVVDSAGDVATTSAITSDGVVLTPQLAQLQAGQSTIFVADGGAGGPYFWSMAVDRSGGMIDTAGHYTAGPDEGSDIVQAQDSLGNVGQAVVSVQARSASDAGSPPDAGTPGGTTGASPDPGGGTAPRHGGCSAADGRDFAVLALLAVAGTRRRRR